MSDNLHITKPLDASRINIHQDYEVNWWCDQFKVTKSQLIAAVNHVGTSASAVKKYLGK